tara:strand:+ start:277 stop:468 length:192 start_codon:yes stop_codon:yes gene_type:complete
MKIGKYIIRRAKTIKHILQNRDQGTKEAVARMLQIYSCRFCGICFYRNEQTFIKERKQFFNCL